MNRREQIEAEAADWLARVDRGLDPEEEGALQQWKADAIEHRIVLLQLQAVWERAGRLRAMSPSRLSAPRTPVRWRLPAAIAAAFSLCLGFGIYYYVSVVRETPQRFETALGKQRSLELADGTHVELDTDTVIHTSVASATRTVRLDHGKAYFEVVHDARHPFVVIAGNRRITDLGTKFSVLVDGDRVEVVVKEGQVRVDPIDPGASQATASVVAERNTVIIARQSETLVTYKPPQEIENEMLWRSGVLSFNQEPLSDVAEDMNRYNARKIEVVGPARDIRIGGSFRSDNIEGFKQLLRDGFRLKIVEADDKIIISN